MSINAGRPGISWTLQSRARIDGALIEFHSMADTEWYLLIRSSALSLGGSADTMSFALSMEDTTSATGETWRPPVITATSAGPKIFLGGYQCFSTTADLSSVVSGPEATLELTPGAGINIRSSTEYNGVLSPAKVLAFPPTPTPFIEFIVARLSGYDIAEFSEFTTGAIFARYRMRGPGQHGTIFTADGNSIEQFDLSVAEGGIEYKVLGRRGERHTFTAHGYWNQGHWHDVVVRVGHGTV